MTGAVARAAAASRRGVAGRDGAEGASFPGGPRGAALRGRALPEASPAAGKRLARRFKPLVVLGASRLKSLDAVVKKSSGTASGAAASIRCYFFCEILIFWRGT